MIGRREFHTLSFRAFTKTNFTLGLYFVSFFEYLSFIQSSTSSTGEIQTFVIFIAKFQIYQKKYAAHLTCEQDSE